MTTSATTLAAILLSIALLVLLHHAYRRMRLEAGSARELAESEARFRSLTELSADWYWEQDEQFRFINSPATQSRNQQARPEHFLGLTRWEAHASSLSAKQWAKHREQLEAHLPFADFEYARPSVDGTYRWISVSGMPVFDAAGTFCGYRGLGRDVTERKREERLVRLEHSITHELAGAATLNGGIAAAISRMCEAMNWKSGRYYHLDSASQAMRLLLAVTAEGEDAEALIRPAQALQFTKGHGMVGTVWSSGRSLWIADIDNDPRVAYPSIARQVHLRSVLLFPVTAGGATLGVISVSSDIIREPDERLQRAIELFGSQIGQYIQRRDAEEQSRLVSGLYAALGGINETILHAVSAEELLRRTCEIAVHSGRFVRAHIRMADGAGELGLVAQAGQHSEHFAGQRVSVREDGPNGASLVAACYRKGKPVIIGDVNEGQAARMAPNALQVPGVRSVGAFPLHAAAGCAGVLVLYGSDERAFDGAMVPLIERIAENVSFGLKRAEAEADRRRAEDDLRRFRFAMDNCADIVLLIDRHTLRHVDANNTACRLLGYSREELLSMGPTDILPCDRAAIDKMYDDLIADPSRPTGMRSYYRCKDGSHLPFESTRRLLRSGDDWLVAVMSKDIREQIAADEARSQNAQRLSSVIALQAELADERLDLGALCEAVVKKTRELIGTGAAAIQFVENDAFVYFAASEGLQHMVGSRTPLKGNFSAAVLTGGKALICRDASNDPNIDPAAALRAGAGSLIGAPLHHEGRVIGVLKLVSGAADAFGEEQVATLELLAGIAGGAIQRKRVQQELLRSESRFRSLTNLSSDWYWEQDTQFRFTKFEGKGGGGSDAAILGRCAWELGGVEHQSCDWNAHRERLVRHESFRQMEYAYRNRAGERCTVSVDGEPVFDEQGAFAGYRGTSRDITRQRRGEEELRRFRAAMDMSHDAIFLIDPRSMRFVDLNASACRDLGRSREELLALGPHNVLAMGREEIEQAYDALIAEPGRAARSERCYSGRNGATRWTEIHSRAVRNGEAWIIVTVARDITERKLAEERQALHLRLQQRLALFGQSALTGRDADELIGEAMSTLLEGLAADAVCYLEPRADGALAVRAVIGLADARAVPGHAGAPSATLQEALESRCPALMRGSQLPLPWAAALDSAAVVPVRSGDTVAGALCVFAREADAYAAEALNFIDAAASVLSTALQRAHSEQRLAFLAQFDPLTGLPNRALLSDRFAQMIVQARRHDAQLGVLFVDLDEFKAVNDSLGHAAGDELLQEVSRRLQSAVRAGDTVARIAGDEFAVVLADLARPEDAALVAQKIITALASSAQIAGSEVFVTASIGIAAFPADGADAESLLSAADAAMYRAKQGGRNAYQFFTADINQRTRARALLCTELRRALEREEFTLYYQPKFDLRSGQPCAAEALLRWNHPERGLVSPAEFIPVLEETGLIVPVGEWVLARACADVKALQACGIRLPVAVNLSARQFRQQDLATRIRRVIRDANVDASMIELEITESQLMHDPQYAIATMGELTAAGIRIAIDDFGTGYSSLSYLTQFPVSALKIDRSFIAGLTKRRADATIVRTVVEMAHTLGFTVVGEGVETPEQAAFLRELGCEQAQGFLFARPMAAADLVLFLRAAEGRERIAA